MTAAPVDLAHEADFVVGGLSVSPSACRVMDSGGEVRVEPRVMEVLIVLHRNLGRTVARDDLIGMCWNGRAVSDDALARAVMKVRQLGRSNTDPPHFTLETVPKVGFRLMAVTEQPTANCDHSSSRTAQPTPPPLGTELDRRHAIRPGWFGTVLPVTAVILVAVWLGVGWDRRSQTPHGLAYVTLLPFKSLTKTDELDRLARQTDDAVARHLVTRGVATIVAGLVGSYSATAHDTELVVTGSVDRKGDTYKINNTVGLRASNVVLWSETVERKISEPDGLHEQAARSLAGVLSCALKERKSAVTMPTEVFSLFLHSCAAESWRSGQALEVTRRLVERAPHLAGAHAHRAIALAVQAESLDHLSDDAVRFAKEATASAERALALDPNSADAHFALSVRTSPDPRFAERERLLSSVLDIDPDHVAALDEYGRLLREVGRVGAAGEVFRRIAPNGNLIQGAMVAAMEGKFGDAYPMIERLEVLSPRYAREVRWVLALWWGDPANALQHIERFSEDAGRADWLPCVRPHLEAIVRKRTVRGLAPACERLDIDWRVRLLARQGDIDGAYRLMAQQFPNSRSPTMFLFYPEMKRFRHDVRFMPLAERLGLLKYWREANQWPDFCAEADLPYDCRT